MQRTEYIDEHNLLEVEEDNLGFDKEEITSVQRASKRKFKHQINYNQRGFSAASISNGVKPILTNQQLIQCANSWINNGIMRQCLNKLVHHLLGQRTKFMVEPNTELTEFSEKLKLAETIT